MSNAPDTRPPKNTSGKTVNGVPNGKRRKHHKATFEVQWERLSTIVKLIGECKTEAQIKKYFRDRADAALDETEKLTFDIHYLTFNNYLIRAREYIIKRQSRTKSEIKSDAVAYYESVVSDDKASRKEKNDAWQALRDLYGLDAPKTLNQRIGDSNGRPLAPAVIAPTVHVSIIGNGREANQIQNGHNGNGHAIPSRSGS